MLLTDRSNPGDENFGTVRAEWLPVASAIGKICLGFETRRRLQLTDIAGLSFTTSGELVQRCEKRAMNLETRNALTRRDF